MSLTYQQQTEKISDEQFLARVQQAAVAVATDVMAESAATAGHTERATFAQQVLHGDVRIKMASAVLLNANCGTGTPDDPLETDSDGDNALKFVVTSNWNAFANYSANP